jgi:cob(I)alamin adenosyltransferase
MKIYTRTGDLGQSSLFSGERVPKHHARMNAYGEVDELNSMIGVLMTALPDGTTETRDRLGQIQSDLFRIGAILATMPASGKSDQLDPIEAGDIEQLEAGIDRLQAGLPELKRFILPGGHSAAGFAHVARTVCRRAERRVVSIMENERDAQSYGTLGQDLVLGYLNRLSDYLFVVARHCNAVAGIDDITWQG